MAERKFGIDLKSYRVQTRRHRRVFFNFDDDINCPEYFPETSSKDEAIKKIQEYLLETHQSNCLNAELSMRRSLKRCFIRKKKMGLPQMLMIWQR